MGAIDNLYDLAAGHGLLGVLLARRFPDVTVTCVDLEKRNYFETYRQAFTETALPAEEKGRGGAAPQPMSNLVFVVGDIADVVIRPRSFVVCIHACNEANKVSVDKATGAGAGFMAMPCCIREGLYSVASVRHCDDDTRYAIAVGAFAASSGAHSVTAIDRQITNRHLCVLGGYPKLGGEVAQPEMTSPAGGCQH